MEIKTFSRLLRWLLLAVAVCVGGIQGWAKTKPAHLSKPAVKDQVLKQNPPKKAWIKDPNQVMPMRQVTNADRRAAAARNAERRAAAKKRQSVPANQGVQQ